VLWLFWRLNEDGNPGTSMTRIHGREDQGAALEWAAPLSPSFLTMYVPMSGASLYSGDVVEH
jgi:hypothetical protein